MDYHTLDDAYGDYVAYALNPHGMDDPPTPEPVVMALLAIANRLDALVLKDRPVKW